MLNYYDNKKDDHYNSGNAKGVRIFKRKDQYTAVPYWECVVPRWDPSTKMVSKMVDGETSYYPPPWIDNKNYILDK